MKVEGPDKQKIGQGIADVLNTRPSLAVELAVFCPERYFACWPARDGHCDRGRKVEKEAIG